ncbi:hypothetical protein Pcac1_g15152 [Phytophthora cactorum]|nr:hypothetical protein Pcac1_g15152 [Phytophthora cactorum]
MNNTKAEQKRRSYSIKDKLAVIAEHEEGVAGSGFYALSNKHDAASGTLRGCWQNCQKLQHASKDWQIATRTARRLGGGGRGPKYPKVEERLHLWILDHYMATLEDLERLVDATYLDNIQHCEADPGELELYASSKLHNWNIEVKTVNADCKVVSTFIYSVEEPDKVVKLARSGSFFAVKVDGYCFSTNR